MENKNKIISTPYGDKNIKVYDYLYGNRLAIFLTDDEGDFSDITVNLTDATIYDIDEGFINSNFDSENGRKFINKLKTIGIIKYSYGFMNYNMGTYELVKFDLNKLKEYDEVGVEKYINKVTDLNIENILNPRI